MENLPVNFNTDPNIDIDLANEQKVIGNIDSDVQEISAIFNADNNLNIQLDNIQNINVDFGIGSSEGCKVLCATTATWNSKPKLISKKGYIYIYSDYRKNSQNQNIPSMKVGDGSAYLIDIPFSDEILYQHLTDGVHHITQAEREFWNNKVRCYIDPNNDKRLIFTTQ